MFEKIKTNVNLIKALKVYGLYMIQIVFSLIIVITILNWGKVISLTSSLLIIFLNISVIVSSLFLKNYSDKLNAGYIILQSAFTLFLFDIVIFTHFTFI